MRFLASVTVLIVLAATIASCKQSQSSETSNAASASAGSLNDEVTGLIGDFCTWANDHSWAEILSEIREHPQEYWEGVAEHGILSAGHIAFEIKAVHPIELAIERFFARLGASAGKATVAAGGFALVTKALLAFEAMKSSCSTAQFLGELKNLIEAKAVAATAQKNAADIDRSLCARMNSLTSTELPKIPSWCASNGFAKGANKGLCGRVKNAPSGGALAYGDRDFSKAAGYIGNDIEVSIQERWVHSAGGQLAVVKVERQSGFFDGTAKVAWMLPGYLEKVECK